jgi:hypothetical protein
LGFYLRQVNHTNARTLEDPKHHEEIPTRDARYWAGLAISAIEGNSLQHPEHRSVSSSNVLRSINLKVPSRWRGREEVAKIFKLEGFLKECIGFQKELWCTKSEMGEERRLGLTSMLFSESPKWKLEALSSFLQPRYTASGFVLTGFILIQVF